MKYKVGDRTLLGEITDHYQTMSGDWVYYIGSQFAGSWFAESDIDAIIIKPKRNIDHLIELWESGSTAAEVREFMCEKRLSTLAEKIDIQKWLAPYTEPSKYPKLTQEDLRAAKWLVDGGFETVYKRQGDVYASYGDDGCIYVRFAPVVQPLSKSEWITKSPINLAELLAAQEV